MEVKVEAFLESWVRHYILPAKELVVVALQIGCSAAPVCFRVREVLCCIEDAAWEFEVTYDTSSFQPFVDSSGTTIIDHELLQLLPEFPASREFS